MHDPAYPPLPEMLADYTSFMTSKEEIDFLRRFVGPVAQLIRVAYSPERCSYSQYDKWSSDLLAAAKPAQDAIDEVHEWYDKNRRGRGRDCDFQQATGLVLQPEIR